VHDASARPLSTEISLLNQAQSISPTGDAFAFYLPATNSKVTVPVVGGGEFWQLSSRPEVVAVQTYLSSATFATSRVQLDNWISATAVYL
jgi:alpha-glucoside transport system substrate-binding protein